MNRKKLVISMASTGIAILVSASAMHGGGSGGLYREMPGIIVGVYSGFFLDNPAIVFPITVAVNSYVYYLALSAVIRLCRRLANTNSN